MIASPLLLVALSAEPVSLAQPDFNVVNVAPEVARFCSEHLAAEMSARGVKVVTAQDIQAVLGNERQKELLGCSDASSSCMAELAAALGTDGILRGDLAKLGTRYQLNLKILSSVDAHQLASYRAGVDREDQLVPELSRAAELLVPELLAKLGRSAQPAGEPPPSVAAAGARSWPLIPTVAAAVLLAGGGVMHGLAFDANGRLRNPAGSPLTEPQARELRDRGQALQAAAFVAYGLAGAGLAVATVLYLRSGAAPVAPAAALTPGGATFGVAGVLP